MTLEEQQQTTKIGLKERVVKNRGLETLSVFFLPRSDFFFLYNRGLSLRLFSKKYHAMLLLFVSYRRRSVSS